MTADNTIADVGNEARAHKLGIRGVDDGVIVTCTCGWKSDRIHPINIDVTYQRHIREVSSDE
jgi:hypothetical protein